MWLRLCSTRANSRNASRGQEGSPCTTSFYSLVRAFFPFEHRGLTDIAAPVSLTTDVLLVTFSTLLLCRVAFSNPDRRVVVAVLTASVIMILYTISYLVIIDTKAVLMGRSFALIETGLHNIKVRTFPSLPPPALTMAVDRLRAIALQPSGYCDLSIPSFIPVAEY